MLFHKICAKDGILEAERVGGCEKFIQKKIIRTEIFQHCESDLTNILVCIRKQIGASVTIHETYKV